MLGNLHILTMELNISRFSFLSNLTGRLTFKTQVKENCTLLHQMVPVPARLSTCKIFQLSGGIILALCGEFQSGSLFRNPYKTQESRSHNCIPICDGKFKTGFLNPKANKLTFWYKTGIREILQMHTEGSVNRHHWDLLLFVKIYNLKKRTDLYYSPRTDWEKTWFNSVQRSAGWQ